ncbi:craniofacial development protein 2-like [Sitophilus oryzae]|uniref:Craniofacial development protein 2-like n=1 Tax=Sitophilus oryzae TaxID=7048 RepID=A0A6J2X9Q5_SITOR|nr:craniofacial development protein 2-like [Sitophilus oryzae]
MTNTEMKTAPSSRRPLDGTGVLRIPGLKNKKSFKIGTWNVRTLYEAGKLRNLLLEIQRMDIQITGVCETRWSDATTFHSEDYAVYTSGTRDRSHKNGVAIIISKSLGNSVRNFVPFSDRVMLLQLAIKPVNINIVQVYAPTTDHDDGELEMFYQHISTSKLKATKKDEITLIIGDWNAKVGRETRENVSGKYGLGVCNARGNRRTVLSGRRIYLITNTWYKLPYRRLYTWTLPQHTQENVVRNQIDYILINRRFRNCIKPTKTYPGADVHSDHNLLCSKLNIRLKKNSKPIKRSRMQQEILKEPEILKNLSQEVNGNMHTIVTPSENKSVEDNWQDIKVSLRNENIDEMIKP